MQSILLHRSLAWKRFVTKGIGEFCEMVLRPKRVPVGLALWVVGRL